MTTLLFSHQDCLEHNPGPGHPERPDRLRAVLAALEGPGFEGLERRDAPLAELAQIARVHPEAFIRNLLDSVPAEGQVAIDMDTAMSPGSGQAALRAAGAVCAAVDAVMAGEARNAFCAVRPPGHHAEPERSMGFCLFNNVAIGAAQARAAWGAAKVAVVDFDVHHGNGTQAAFAADPAFFYASTHQWPLYPGTGRPEERGCGNILNAVLPPGAGSDRFRAAMTDQVLPALEAFGPDLVMISAGFDAHTGDPLAELDLQDADYGWATAELCGLASRHAGARVVSVLEGGYSLSALGSAAREHVAALIHAPAPA